MLHFSTEIQNLITFKRVVVDEEISPLISTEMDKMYSLFRCVRFGEEIALEKELDCLNEEKYGN